MAENHPVGFQWVIEARERGAEIIHVDPRFTRTSAMATKHVAIRPGSDIAFLGGIVNYILEKERDFREYVTAYTNAATIVNEKFADTEDLDGLFSGYDPENKTYDPQSWQYEGMGIHGAAGDRSGHQAGGAVGAPLSHGHPPREDPSLQHPRCVYQVLRRHFARYTPEMVERICGTPQQQLVAVAEALCRNSGRERTSAFCYAVGWTQHTVGVQYIRTAAIIQLLLGNIGRPGGGILALRGHASIQGSTDIPTLYEILPGYIPMPKSKDENLKSFLEGVTSVASYWANMPAYTISLMKAYFGDKATVENDWCFGHIPRLTGDHSTYPTTLNMLDGKVRGFFVIGENPAVGSSNSSLHRRAMAKLDWLVVRDFFETETASFWYDSPEIETGRLSAETIGTEVFLLPAADHTEKNGSFTNTQRLLQWHHAAVEPKDDCRSELWFYYHLGRRIREKLADSTNPMDRAILDLAWKYPTSGIIEEPDAQAILREVNGWDAQGKALSSYEQLKADGSTTCGCWIYCGVYKDETNHAADRMPGGEQDWVAAQWGWAWPANRRMLYNRASADPNGKPWSERKRYVWWDESKNEWTGVDIPDFKKTKAPTYEPPDGAKAEEALSGTEPFIMQADGKGWLFAPDGLTDGPLPAHYEPEESSYPNLLYGQRSSPARQRYSRPENPYHPSNGSPHADVFPYIYTTYRLTEHHTAGGMTRTVSHLAELQPEFFCEVHPVLARERGLEHSGWATIITARSAIEARVLVTERIANGIIGLPYHWGSRGIAVGDSANDLMPIVTDPNVHIQESKASTCDIVAGRRPRGPALTRLVNDYRTRAGLSAEV